MVKKDGLVAFLGVFGIAPGLVDFCVYVFNLMYVIQHIIHTFGNSLELDVFV